MAWCWSNPIAFESQTNVVQLINKVSIPCISFGHCRTVLPKVGQHAGLAACVTVALAITPILAIKCLLNNPMPPNITNNNLLLQYAFDMVINTAQLSLVQCMHFSSPPAAKPRQLSVNWFCEIVNDRDWCISDEMHMLLQVFMQYHKMTICGLASWLRQSKCCQSHEEWCTDRTCMMNTTHS